MADGLNVAALQRWRRDPAAFIETYLFDPETGQPFSLLAAEREFLRHALSTDAGGRLRYSELIFAAIKKSGKTGFAAMLTVTLLLLYGGRYAEAYCVANDLEQAQSRVFEMCRRIVATSPLLSKAAKITADRITFADTGATIACLASDYASAAGGHPTIAVFDELWGYTSERSRRLFDELIPVPTRKISCRLTVTHAGFEGESELLYQLYKRGLQLPQVGTDLHAGDGLLMFWSHTPIAPWQTLSWLAEMRRSLRANQFLRMIENRFVTSEQSFVNMAQWDACVQPYHPPADRALPVYVGVDASTKHDTTAIVAVTKDSKAGAIRLVTYRIFQPSPDAPLDFANTVERVCLELQQRFSLRKVLFDPWQMQSVAQRLRRAGVPIEEYPQSPANLTAASQNLYELISDGRLLTYPDAVLRLAVSRAIAVETPRGWRISKDKQSHKIDVVVALAMACHAAVQVADRGVYDDYRLWVGGPPVINADASWRRLHYPPAWTG